MFEFKSPEDAFNWYITKTKAKEGESPIEHRLCCAILALDDYFDRKVIHFEANQEDYAAFPEEQPWTVLHREETDFVWEQVQIGKYRADFLIGRISHIVRPVPGEASYGNGREVLVKSPLIVVECDGHDFHEKTKEQAAHDKQRDRAIQAAGYRILRFTGSEIHRAPMKCAAEISNFLDGLIWPSHEITNSD